MSDFQDRLGRYIQDELDPEIGHYSELVETCHPVERVHYTDIRNRLRSVRTVLQGLNEGSPETAEERAKSYLDGEIGPGASRHRESARGREGTILGLHYSELADALGGVRGTVYPLLPLDNAGIESIPDDPGKFVTLEEAAAALGRDPEDLERLISSGDIRAYREGRIMRLRASDVRAVYRDLFGDEEETGS